MSYKQSTILAASAALLLIGCAAVAADDVVDDATGRSALGYGTGGYGSGGYGSGGYGGVGYAPSTDSYKKLVQDTQEFHSAYLPELDKIIEKIEHIHEKAVYKKDKSRIPKPQASQAYPYAYDPNLMRDRIGPNGRPFA